jgi:HAD superfamily hydrolase (TIGR01509 family)
LIKALIFDFDGLLIDTEMADYQAWLETYRYYGLDYPLSEFQKIIGKYTSIPVPLDQLDRLKGPLDREAVDARRMQRSVELAFQQPLLPGVLDYLEAAHRQGLKVAIASSSPRNWLDRFLIPRDLTRHFDAILTGDTVQRVKPDPELFITALKRLAVEPAEALIFEDSVNGLKAAHAAGIRCIIIPSSLTRGMEFQAADLILDSLDARSLDQLIEQFNKM